MPQQLEKHKTQMENNIICPKCGVGYDSKKNLMSHIIRIHNETCHFCYKNFETKQHVKSHISEDHFGRGKRKFYCSICNVNQKSQVKLIEHLESEHNIKYKFQ